MAHLSASASASNAHLNLDSFLAPAHTWFPWWSLATYPIPPSPVSLFQAPSVLHLIHVSGSDFHLWSGFYTVMFLTSTLLISSLLFQCLSSSFVLVIVYYDFIVWYLSVYSIYYDLIVNKSVILVEFKFFTMILIKIV